LRALFLDTNIILDVLMQNEGFWEDMEDALQAWCATKAGADVFVTRDMDGFPNLEIPVIDPANILLSE